MEIIDQMLALINKAKAETPAEPVSAPEPVVEAVQAPPTPQPVPSPETAPKPVAEAPAQEPDVAKQLADVQKALAEQNKAMERLAQRPEHTIDSTLKDPPVPKHGDYAGLRALFAKELTDDKGQFKGLDWANPNGWWNPAWRGTQGF